MNDLLDVLDAWQNSKPKPLDTTVLSGGTSQVIASSGGSTVEVTSRNAQVTQSQYFPTPTKLPPGTSNEDPEADGGAIEILYVNQTKGAYVDYTPINVRTYPVRGNVI